MQETNAPSAGALSCGSGVKQSFCALGFAHLFSGSGARHGRAVRPAVMAGAAHGDGAAGQRQRPRRHRNGGAATGDGVGGAERPQAGGAEPLHQPAAGVDAATAGDRLILLCPLHLFQAPW